MKKLMIVNTGLVDNYQIEALAAGEIGIFPAGTTLSVDDITTISQPFQFGVKLAAKDLDFTPTFSIKEIKGLDVFSYSAGTKMSKTLNFTPSSGDADANGVGEYTLKIVNTTSGQAVLPKKTFSVSYVAGIDEDVLHTAFAAAINVACKEIDLGVVATVSAHAAHDLVLTGDTTFNTFEIFVGDSYAPAVTAVANVPEVGTPLWLQMMEDRFNGYKGYWNRIDMPKVPPSYINSTYTYNVMAIHVGKIRSDHSATKPFAEQYYEIYIAEKVGVTPSVITTFEDIYNRAMNVIPDAILNPVEA